MDFFSEQKYFELNEMKNILITGAGSYVGESVRRYILAKDSSYQIDAVDTVGDNWKKVDYTKYDVVFPCGGYCTCKCRSEDGATLL